MSEQGASIIALLQMNPTVGDITGNAQRLERFVRTAKASGAVVSVSTELAICGYPPRDLLMQSSFVELAQQSALSLDVEIPSLIGTPTIPEHAREKPGNGVALLGNQAPVKIVARKQLLPTYDVFDEARYFDSDDRPGIARTLSGSLELGVTVCEDAWQVAGETPSEYDADPIEQLAEWGRQGVNLDATVNLSASPYHANKIQTRLHVARTAAKTLGHPFLLCNQIGGNDDLLFDGRSLAAWPSGDVVVAPAWEEGILLVDINNPQATTWVPLEDVRGELVHYAPHETGEERGDVLEELADAVVLGLRDYCQKSGIERIVLGLSGGIDSAVAACVAAQAVGAENVLGISMPSRFSSQHSIDDAKHTAEALGMEYASISIDEHHASLEQHLSEMLEHGAKVAQENIQARLRGILVMAHANAQGRMAIATGNKSELAQGYCTLYGDMAGGYTPLGDVYKMEVYGLAEVFNRRAIAQGREPPVNDSTLTKPPSAELAPNQRDDDTLPPYETLDSILKYHIEQGLGAEAIAKHGFDHSVVVSVLQRLEANEHKRWQMAPAPRVSSRAFGQGWRHPLASKHDWRR